MWNKKCLGFTKNCNYLNIIIFVFLNQQTVLFLPFFMGNRYKKLEIESAEESLNTLKFDFINVLSNVQLTLYNIFRSEN